jgi:SpoIIAA-like
VSTPAIERIPTNTPHLFAFEVRGKIRESDIEQMADTVERGFDMFDTVDMLVLMTDYDGAELSAMLDSKNLSAQARSVRHVRKYAVVGAPKWAEMMINVASHLSPVDARTFDLDEVDEAWEWVRA